VKQSLFPFCFHPTISNFMKVYRQLAASFIIANVLSVPSVIIDRTKEIISINQWNLKADSVEINSGPLFEWETNEQLKFSSAQIFTLPLFNGITPMLLLEKPGVEINDMRSLKEKKIK
jgi:hypothetical protein